MIFYCIRHGESIYNAQGRIQGQTDVPLSERGARQGAAIVGALKGRSIEAVYSSPLTRALDTSRILAKALEVDVLVDERLMEIHAGIFQERLWSEIEQAHPMEAARWKSRDPDFVIPNGESRRQLMSRGGAVFREIFECDYSSVAVVAHGGLLTAIFQELLGIPAERHTFRFFNASISQLEWTDQPRLLTLNQVDHLNGIDDTKSLHPGDL